MSNIFKQWEIDKKKRRNIYLLIDWRDEVNEKTRARAIQKVITKIYLSLSEMERQKVKQITRLNGVELFAC